MAVVLVIVLMMVVLVAMWASLDARGLLLLVLLAVKEGSIDNEAEQRLVTLPLVLLVNVYI